MQTVPFGDQMGTEAADKKAVSCSVPTLVGGGSGAGGECCVHISTSDPGALDMVKIEEEERRLREKASVLQVDLSTISVPIDVTAHTYSGRLPSGPMYTR